MGPGVVGNRTSFGWITLPISPRLIQAPPVIFLRRRPTSEPAGAPAQAQGQTGDDCLAAALTALGVRPW
jgi:hypothetical protein